MKAEAIAKKIKLVCLDVDGVLTDGSIIISGQGELFKPFYVRDGLGIKFLQDCGMQVAICTGRQSDIVIERAKELGITLLMQGQKDKREGLAEICRFHQKSLSGNLPPSRRLPGRNRLYGRRHSRLVPLPTGGALLCSLGRFCRGSEESLLGLSLPRRSRCRPRTCRIHSEITGTF